ncbi:MAG: DUF2939 domain-containing protein [Chamaesiphon sp.]|nr:DUF2939 domain-containing protein [Chamaesiphon sp.]
MFYSLSDRLRKYLKSLDRKTIIIGAAASTTIAAIAGGGLYYAPYLTIDSMQNAATNRNADALSQQIDFTALRISIKENIQAQVIKQIAAGNQTPKMTPELIEKMVSPMVDKIITPEGLEQLMLDKIPEAKIDLGNLDRDIAKSDINMGYESLDRFVVHITDKVDRSKDVSLILKRDGIAWKLAGIDISKLADI